MIFITGKKGEGKREFAKAMNCDLKDSKSIFFLSDFIETHISIADVDKVKFSAIEKIQNGNFQTIISSELGLGVVQMDKKARMISEINGEVSQFIAKLADEVYLVTKGEGARIK